MAALVAFRCPQIHAVAHAMSKRLAMWTPIGTRDRLCRKRIVSGAAASL